MNDRRVANAVMLKSTFQPAIQPATSSSIEFPILVAHDQQALPISQVPTLAAHNQPALSIDQDLEFDIGRLEEEPTCSYTVLIN